MQSSALLRGLADIFNMNKSYSIKQAIEFSKFLKDQDQKQFVSTTHEPTSKLKSSENFIQSLIIKDLEMRELRGELYFQRTNTIGIKTNNNQYRKVKGQHRGFPDIFIIKNGKILFLEIKNYNGNQSQFQKISEMKLVEQGAKYYIVRTYGFYKKIMDSF